MKLTKQQINAIALQFIQPVNAKHDAEAERRLKAQRSAWDKTSDGRLYAKLPDWMKKEIGDYDIRRSDSYRALEIKTPLPPKLEYGVVENEIIISTIDAQSVADIMDNLANTFKN